MPSPSPSLLCSDVLELPRRIEEIVGVRLGSELARVGLLDKVLVALLLSKVDGILLALEVDVRSLHVVARRLPSHQRVLPSVALGENVPVHPPALAAPVTRLRGGLRLPVDAVYLSDQVSNARICQSFDIPDGAGLQLHWGAGNDGRRKHFLFTTVLDLLWDGSERSNSTN